MPCAPSASTDCPFFRASESITDTPMLQVYPQSGEQDPTGSADRSTFGGGGDPKRQSNLVIHADYYAATRANIGEDMADIVAGIDAMYAIFEAQDKKPYFGLDGIKAFQWRWERVEFIYNKRGYAGARFYLSVRVF